MNKVNYIFYLLFMSLLSQNIYSQRSLQISNDTINLGDSVSIIFQTSMQQDGSVGGCGEFLYLRDTLKNIDTLNADFMWALNRPIFSGPGCLRLDTLSYKPNNVGILKILGYWNVTDSSNFFGTNQIEVYRYDTATIQLTVLNPTSLSEIEENDFKISPNPVKDYLIIENSQSKSLEQIEIFDLRGKLVFEKINPENEIDLGFLTSGIYIVRGKLNEEFFEKKIMKE